MVTYDIIKEKLLDYRLLTGKTLGSGELPSHSREGTWNSTEWVPLRGDWV